MARSLPRREVVALVDSRLARIIGKELPILAKVRRFVVKSGGKRIRPLTHYYLTRTLNGEHSEWVDVAAIGELIHAASLLHDDVIDEAEQRRGAPSVNALHGNKSAILAGDYLLACGLNHLSSLEHSAELLPIFTRVVRMLAIGELVQMQCENRPDTSARDYERVIAGKTASLFGAMTEAAWILAQSATDHAAEGRRLAREFGERLGRVFQIRDDFLDYFGASEGKPPLQDFRRGLMTRPSILLRASLKGADRRRFDTLWRSQSLRANAPSEEQLRRWLEDRALRKRLAAEIESEVHMLMHYLRRQRPGPEREALLEQLTKLLVS